MKHDELVKKLRSGCDANTAFLLCYEAADAIVYLQARVAELESRNERLQVQLAGCGVAASQNTRASIAEHRIGRDAYGHSASYEEVCNAVDREIEWRERAKRAETELMVAHALLNEARQAIYALDAREDWNQELDRIDAALAGHRREGE